MSSQDTSDLQPQVSVITITDRVRCDEGPGSSMLGCKLNWMMTGTQGGMTHLHRPSLEEDFYSADQGNIFQPFIQQLQHNVSAAVFGYSLDIHH